MTSLLAAAPLFHSVVKKWSGSMKLTRTLRIVVIGEHGVAANTLALKLLRCRSYFHYLSREFVKKSDELRR
jgi:hypothetical protein